MSFDYDCAFSGSHAASYGLDCWNQNILVEIPFIIVNYLCDPGHVVNLVKLGLPDL